MTTFTARRAQHQLATSAEITGELPTAALLCGCPHGTDGSISSTGDASQERLGYRERCFGWSGCLDAPELLPVGGVREVYIDPAIGGMGHEGFAARNQRREAYF